MAALIRRLDPWGPPLALMALIFFLSAQQDLSSGLGTLDLVGRKFVHAGIFGLLCFLLWRAFAPSLSPRTALTVAFGVTVAYAVSDELHQTVVPTRSGSPVDVAIDTVGAAAVALAIRARALARAHR